VRNLKICRRVCWGGTGWDEKEKSLIKTAPPPPNTGFVPLLHRHTNALLPPPERNKSQRSGIKSLQYAALSRTHGGVVLGSKEAAEIIRE